MTWKTEAIKARRAAVVATFVASALAVVNLNSVLYEKPDKWKDFQELQCWYSETPTNADEIARTNYLEWCKSGGYVKTKSETGYQVFIVDSRAICPEDSYSVFSTIDPNTVKSLGNSKGVSLVWAPSHCTHLEEGN